MAISTKQRKSIGRRYSTDPAIDYEMARLEREYQLAPGREARGMQVSENEKSREQSESQFSRGLEQSDKNAARQEEQFYASLAQAQAQHAASIDLATKNYNLAVKTAKDDVEYKAALLEYQKAKDAADRAYAAERDSAAASSAMYGTIGNTALTGAMLRAATMEKGAPFFGKTVGKLFGGGDAVTPAVTPSTSTIATNPVTAMGATPEAGANISGLGRNPYVVDQSLAPPPQTPLGGTNPYGITPSVVPVEGLGGAGLEGLSVGGIESGLGFGGQIGAGSAYGGGVAVPAAELIGGIESGIGLGGQIGAATGAEAAGSAFGTVGGALGSIASGVSIAAPYYALAKAGGMGINAIVANNPQFQNTPFSRLGGSLTEPLNVEGYWANELADIGIGNSTINSTIAAILNPVGWAISRITWICTEIGKEEPLSDDENEALSKLRRYTIKNHKEDARAYLKNGYLLIKSLDLDLEALKTELVDKCCDLVNEDKMEEAFNHYKAVVIKLCEESGFDVGRLYEEEVA